ncbi:hypothetical protein SNE40_001746 [Patella caerulea]|uniref:Uncharacterized protein n=1 Tax=Patella caerulea TaxID=87958 RepID=A0AAN8Q6L8_PATCE
MRLTNCYNNRCLILQGKGEQTTYWLEGRTDDKSTQLRKSVRHEHKFWSRKRYVDSGYNCYDHLLSSDGSSDAASAVSVTSKTDSKREGRHSRRGSQDK